MTWLTVAVLGIPLVCALALVWLLRSRPSASLSEAADALAKTMAALVLRGERRRDSAADANAPPKSCADQVRAGASTTSVEAE